MATFKQLKAAAPLMPKQPYTTHGFWNNPSRLEHIFGMHFSYTVPVTRDLLDKMKTNCAIKFYEVINNELIFEQEEGYRSQLWDLLTEEEKKQCIRFCSDAPVQLISAGSLGSGSVLTFNENWTLNCL